MNETEQIIEKKSNDPKYMKKYLKLALDIEADVLVWEDALASHQAHLKNTKNEIDTLKNARREGDIFEGTKDCIRSGMQEQIAALEEKLKVEEKIEKRKKKKKKIVYGCILVAMFIFSCFFLFSKAEQSDISVWWVLVLAAALSVVLFVTLLMLKLYFGFWGGLVRAFLGKSDSEEETQKELRKLRIQLHELDKEEKETMANNQYIDSHLPQIIQKQSYLENSINQISYHLDESRKIRNMIYSEGVLPVRYRNIVSVASLYQFLENGICTQVKGHGGIYDTYEYHLKLKEIIDNLVEIRRDLRRIQANQEFLYDKLCDVHETLNDINAGIGSSLKEVSSNTAVAAEAAKRTAIAEEWRNREIWYR